MLALARRFARHGPLERPAFSLAYFARVPPSLCIAADRCTARMAIAVPERGSVTTSNASKLSGQAHRLRHQAPQRMDSMTAFLPSRLAWRPDLPDPRDYASGWRGIGKSLGRRPAPANPPMVPGAQRRSVMPKRVDWREYCPAVEDRAACHGRDRQRLRWPCCQYFQRRATAKSSSLQPSLVDYITRVCLPARATAASNCGPPGRPSSVSAHRGLDWPSGGRERRPGT